MSRQIDSTTSLTSPLISSSAASEAANTISSTRALSLSSPLPLKSSMTYPSPSTLTSPLFLRSSPTLKSPMPGAPRTTPLTRPITSSSSTLHATSASLPTAASCAVPEDNTASAAPSGLDAHDSERKVPGAGATTVQATALWSSLVRWILDGPPCALRSFFHSTFTTRANKVKEPCNAGHVWPMPLPYPRVGRGLEIQERAQRQAQNCMVVIRNWLHLKQPAKVPTNYFMDLQMTPDQKAVVLRLRRLSKAWADSGPIAAADMGRSAGKVETMEAMLEQLTREAVKLSKQKGSGKMLPREAKKYAADSLLRDVQVAKPIEARRLQFSGKPGYSSNV